MPNVTDVVVPLGGGGLGAGVALAIKTFNRMRVIGAIPEGSVEEQPPNDSRALHAIQIIPSKVLPK